MASLRLKARRLLVARGRERKQDRGLFSGVQLAPLLDSPVMTKGGLADIGVAPHPISVVTGSWTLLVVVFGLAAH